MSQDQQYLLDYYLNLYNQTIRQIDLMHLSLDSIRYNMDTISGLTTPARRNRRRHRPRQQQQQQQQQQQSRQRTPSSSSSANAYNTAYFEYYIPHSSDPDVTSLLNLFQSLGATTTAATAATATAATATTATTATTNTRAPVMDSSANSIAMRLMHTTTRTIPYSEISNPLNTQCPIYLTTFVPTTEVVQILGCGHIFTPSSITAWFRTNTKCPVCRYDVRLHGTLSDPCYSTNQPT